MYSHAGPVSFPFSYFPGDPKYPKNSKNPKSEFENFSLRINIFDKPILAAGSDFNIPSGFLQIIFAAGIHQQKKASGIPVRCRIS